MSSTRRTGSNHVSAIKRSRWSETLRLRVLDRVAGEVLRRRTLSGFTCNDLQKLVGDTTNRYATENLTAIDGRRWREIGFERLLLIAESLGLDMDTITLPVEHPQRTARAAEQVAA